MKVIDRILAISGEKETSPAEVDGKRLGGWWKDREKSIDISHHQSLSRQLKVQCA